MNKYIIKYPKSFLRDIKKLRDGDLRKRLTDKIDKITTNPSQYKSLRNVFKGKQRIHIGSYVLIFEFQETEETIVFHRFQHHDKVYKTKIQ